MEKNNICNFIGKISLVFLLLFFTFCSSASFDTLSKFSFEPETPYIKIIIPASANSTRVFGLFETSDASVVFELRFGTNLDLINMPAGDIELSIEKATGFCSEDSYLNGTELHIEIELEESSFTIRSRNAEQYPLDTQLLPHEHFRLLFFSSDDLCVLPATTTTSAQSEFHLHPPSPSSENSTVSSSSSPPPSPSSRSSTKRKPTHFPNIVERTATMRTAFERTTPNIYGKVRFATYKMLQIGTTPNPSGVSYIDIIKDRDVYESVQRSDTREINNVWSPTFLLFFGVETLIIGGFVIFGFIMFIILQCKPRDATDDKFIRYEP
uniref:Uncharacterized protein n=1 Tax=Panagrolaimus sp. PS1159 TaxID=55785 RepID=A0AC35GGP5_9BILA